MNSILTYIILAPLVGALVALADFFPFTTYAARIQRRGSDLFIPPTEPVRWSWCFSGCTFQHRSCCWAQSSAASMHGPSGPWRLRPRLRPLLHASDLHHSLQLTSTRSAHHCRTPIATRCSPSWASRRSLPCVGAHCPI